VIGTLTAFGIRISETNVRLKQDFAPDVSHRRDRRDGGDHGDRVEQLHADQVDELNEDRQHDAARPIGAICPPKGAKFGRIAALTRPRSQLP
jgi:hypothetical protein